MYSPKRALVAFLQAGHTCCLQAACCHYVRRCAVFLYSQLAFLQTSAQDVKKLCCELKE